MAKDTFLQLRIDDELKVKLADAAAAEDRSSSYIVTRLIRDWLNTREPTPKIVSLHARPFSGDPPSGVRYRRPKGRPRLPAAEPGRDAWTPLVEPYVATRERVTAAEVLEYAVKIEPSASHPGHLKAVEIVLTDLGWKPWIEIDERENELPVWLKFDPM